MKYFVYRCEDIPSQEEAAAIRSDYLADHLAYVERHLQNYAVAGPDRHGDGEYHSSTFIVKAQTLEEADALMRGDPYVAAGLYLEVAGVEFMPVAGEWVGGLSWK